MRRRLWDQMVLIPLPTPVRVGNGNPNEHHRYVYSCRSNGLGEKGKKSVLLLRLPPGLRQLSTAQGKMR